MKRLAQLVPLLVFGLGVGLGVSACKKDSASEGGATAGVTQAPGDRGAAPASSVAAAAGPAAKVTETCSAGATRCQGG